MRSLIMTLGDCGENKNDLAAIAVDTAEFFLRNIAALLEQLQPISRFVCFLVCDVLLCEEIRSALGTVCLSDICSDARSAFEQLP